MTQTPDSRPQGSRLANRFLGPQDFGLAMVLVGLMFNPHLHCGLTWCSELEWRPLRKGYHKQQKHFNGIKDFSFPLPIC